MRLAHEIEIRRPPDEVFACLATLERIPEWNPAIVETRRLTPGPVRVGTRIRQQRSSPTTSVEELEVTALDPGRSLVLVGELGPLRGTIAYRLHPTPGGTRLENIADVEASGLARLLAPLAAGRVRSAVAENLAALKRIVEQAGSPPAES